MPNINAAIQWATEIALDDTHGYSQANRYGPDYDCSSFIAAALIHGGFNVPASMWTGNERECLLAAGFKQIAVGTPPIGGDIMLTHEVGGIQHTGMFISPTQFVQASSDYDGVTGDSSGNEIWIGNLSTSSGWQYMFRYRGATDPDPVWHNKPTGAYAIDSYEAKDNALMTYKVLSELGWSLNAVCGILGNIGAESGYNPWRWQSDDILESTDTAAMQSATHGYGLLQYTPASKYNLSTLASNISGFGPNYSDKSGSTNDGTAQLIFCNNTEGYYPTEQYPMTFAEYKRSTASAADLAEIWLYNYERPADPSATLQARRNNAAYWYGILKESRLKRKTSMPVWMMLKNRRRY